MPVYTLRSYGQTSTFHASNVEQLGKRLHTRTHWLRVECLRLAAELWRGRVVSAPDFETIVLPGFFDVLEDRPEERFGHSDGPGPEPKAEGAARPGTSSDDETPLLSGGL